MQKKSVLSLLLFISLFHCPVVNAEDAFPTSLEKSNTQLLALINQHPVVSLQVKQKSWQKKVNQAKRSIEWFLAAPKRRIRSAIGHRTYRATVDELASVIDDCCDDLSNQIDDVSDKIEGCCYDLRETVTECCDDLAGQIQEVKSILEECCEDIKDHVGEANFASDEIIDAITECCDDLSGKIQDVKNILEECCDDLSGQTDAFSGQVDQCCAELLEAITECCQELSMKIEVVDNDLDTCCENLTTELSSLETTMTGYYTNISNDIDEIVQTSSEILTMVDERTTTISTQITDLQNTVEECCDTLSTEIVDCCSFLSQKIDSITCSGGADCGIPITAAQIPFTILVSGHYFLQDSITIDNKAFAIAIAADNVVLDLCGNVITGINGSQTGVTSTNHNNITITNGTIDPMTVASINLSGCTNIELSGLKLVGSFDGVRMIDCGNSLVKNVAAYSCSAHGFYLADTCTDPNVVLNKNNCFMQCQVFETVSPGGDAYGFRSLGGYNNSFIECVVKDVQTQDVTNASTAAGFGLGISTDGINFCQEAGTNIIDCEIFSVMAADTQNNGGSTPYGIKLDSAFEVSESVILLDQQNHGTQVNSVAWSPSGCYIATGATPINKDSDTKVWQVDQVSGEIKVVAEDNAVSGSSDTVKAIAFSPDGCFLIAGGEGDGKHNIGTWDFNDSNGEITDNMVEAQGRTVYALAFSPDGCFLATGSDRKNSGQTTQLQIWEISKEGGSPLLTSIIQKNNVVSDNTFSFRSLSWSPDGKFLASGDNGSNNNIRIWEFDAFNLTLTQVDSETHGTSVNALAYSPDGCFLASGASAVDSEIKIWKVNKATGAITQIVSINADHGDQVNGLSWSQDGKQLASAGKFGAVNVFDVKIWEFNPVVPSLIFDAGYAQGTSPNDFALSVAYSPTDCFMASGAKASNVGSPVQTTQGQLQTRSTGILYPKQCLIKRNEITRVSGGCGGFGIQGGCDNIFLNNLVYEAERPYSAVTNTYAKGLGGIPNAFDNTAFPPTCTQGQCDHVARSGFTSTLKSVTRQSNAGTEQPTRSMPTRSPSSVTSAHSASITISGLPFVIKRPGTYILGTDGNISGRTAITIASSNVTLDLAGHTIVGENGFLMLGADPSYGIRTEDGSVYDNITIINGTISAMSGAGIYIKDGINISMGDINVIDSKIGIKVEGAPILDPDVTLPTSSHVYIGDVRSSGHSKAGYVITGVDGVTLLNTVAENSGYDTPDLEHGGYVISTSTNVVFENSISKGNTYGYYLSMIHSGSLRSCGALFNSKSGFYLLGDDPGSGLIPTQRVTIQQCKTINNQEKGIELNAAMLNTILECECKTNTQEGVYLSTDSTFNFVSRVFASTNGSYGIYDGTVIDGVSPTTNRIFINFGQNNAGAGPYSASVDVNYHNVPAIIQLQPAGGTALNAITNATAGALSNIST